MRERFWNPATVRYYLSWWWELVEGCLPRRDWGTLRRPPLYWRKPRDEPAKEAVLIRTDLERALAELRVRDVLAYRAIVSYYCDPRVRGEHSLLRLVHAADAALGDPGAIGETARLIRIGTDLMAAYLAGDLDNAESTV